MCRILTIAAVVVLFFACSVQAVEYEYLIASWENTMDHFGNGGFDAMTITTYDGVTKGSYALELDCKPAWTQGLRTAYVDGLNPDWQPFFPALTGAQYLRIDVTTSNVMANVPMSSGIQLNLFIQGGSNGVAFNVGSYGYKLIMGVYSQNTTTETIEWDLSKDSTGNPVPLPPAFSAATGGWFDMRINTSIVGNAAPNPGTIIVDNLRAVKIGGAKGLGDFNGDKTVNQADYTSWADNFGLTIAATRAAHATLFLDNGFVPTATPADQTVITQAMYTTWADHFGWNYDDNGARVVPEPATMTLLGLGALGLIRRRS